MAGAPQSGNGERYAVNGVHTAASCVPLTVRLSAGPVYSPSLIRSTRRFFAWVL